MTLDPHGRRFSLVGFGNVYSRRLARTLMSDVQSRVDLYSNAHCGLNFRGQVIGSTACIEQLHGVVIICPFNPGPFDEIWRFVTERLTEDATVYSIEEFILEFGLPKGMLGFPQRTLLEIYRSLESRSPFGDAFSSETLSAMADYWDSGHRSRLRSVARPISELYFDKDLIPEYDRHVYVDAGAYTGDSFRAFRRRFPKFDSATLFEPNHYEELSALECDRVAVRHFALGSKSGEIQIGRDAVEMVPQFGDYENPEPTVEFRTLDNSVDGLSFLKIDCEGYDMEVLYGGIGVVASMKPIVALCVYHDPTHMIQGIQFFEDIGGYKLHLRKYSADPAELVIYALPD